MAEQLSLPPTKGASYIRRIDFKHKAGRNVPFRRIYLFNPDKHMDYMQEALAPFFAFALEDWVINFEHLWFKISSTTAARTSDTAKYHGKKNIREVAMDGDHVAVPFISRKRISGPATWGSAKRKGSSWGKIVGMTQSDEDGRWSRAAYEKSNLSDLRDKDLDEPPKYRGNNKSYLKFSYFRKFALREPDEESELKPRPIEIRHPDWDVWEQKAFPATSYLVDKYRVFDSICQACPREPLHYAGQCRVGDPICHVQLKDYFDEDFYGNLSRYSKWVDSNLDIRELCKEDEDEA